MPNNTHKQATIPTTTDELIGKRQPQAIEVERHVLGGILIEPNVYGEIAETLKPASFYEPKHQLIYEAIMDLAQGSESIDFLTVTERLRRKGQLEKAGGADYIAGLTTDVASAAHIEAHAAILAQKALARQLITMGLHIAEDAFDETTDVEELMNETEARIFDIAQNSQKKDVRGLGEILSDALDKLKKQADKSNGGVTGVPSGFDKLDKLTSGWQPSNLIIIAARPAMGKTAFVLSMAKNMGVMGRPVAIFSLEMSSNQLAYRLVSNVCAIEGSKLRSGFLSRDDWNALDQNYQVLENAPIYIDDTPGISIFELKSKARRLVREKGVECIIIDYLQLMSAGQKMQSRELEVSAISRALKGLAMELDIPIIALSQLNRQLEGRAGVEGKIPQLSDLRESGSIEQDADMVCFIHRYDYFYRQGERSEGYDPNEVGKGHVIIAKHRNGAIGDVKLRFINVFAKFDNDDDITQGLTGNTYSSFQSRVVASNEGYNYASAAQENLVTPPDSPAAPF
jgi:replicative DNA helicase